MASSRAATVEEYLSELPPGRREVIAAVRDAVLGRLPSGYQESMSFGMISWEIPLERYPKTYNKKPLAVAALAAQKRFNSLYLLGAYADEGRRAQLERAFDEAGLKLDMGKSCVHFQKVEDLPLEAIGDLIASLPPERMIEAYERSRAK